MLPYPQDAPIALLERAYHEQVPALVSSKFRFPEFLVACWMSCVRRAPVPKAPVHEYRQMLLGEDKIGVAE